MSGKTPSKNQKSGPRPAKNKRPKTRHIVRWDTKLDILLLLAIDKVCKDEGIKIPYDKCGPEVAPSVTGNAIVQHLAKLRKKIGKTSAEDGGKPVTNFFDDPNDSNGSYNPDTSAAVSTTAANNRGRKRNKQAQTEKKASAAKTTVEKEVEEHEDGHLHTDTVNEFASRRVVSSATNFFDTFDEGKDRSTEPALTKAADSMGIKRVTWRLGSEESDDEEYVAADSSLVIKEEIDSDEDKQELEDSPGRDMGRSSYVVVLRIPEGLKRAISEIESGQYRVASGTEGLQYTMGASAQVPNAGDVNDGPTNGMYDFNPEFFPETAAIYPTDVQIPLENDVYFGGSYGNFFFDQGTGFPDMDFSNFQATFADSGPANFHPANVGPPTLNNPAQQLSVPNSNAAATTSARPGRFGHRRSHPVDIRFTEANKYYDIGGSYSFD